MEHILVATDGSEPALHAARHAAEIAKRLGDCEILLLNVQEPVEEMQTHGLAREAIREHRAKLARNAGAAAMAAIADRGVPVVFDWQFGDPARVIAETARARHCGQIVMGTRGAGPLENLLIGSVAFKVLHIAAVPVTLVR